ncbi:nuclear transcription factor y subunit b-3 [Arabis alpina]|uniref:Nuclear transcription factor y subunit b-3 n=1 Tax=Arabis alpina TaxID=50452 RepID=A0A087GNA4_ARAAL|nr:nuclear transcription factor y subunit b-3 [Arabis alpina]
MGDSDRDSGGGQNGNNQNGQSPLSPREQDRFLPIANVSRIMKKALPANAKISKDAKETMQECVSEFISFVTGEASDKCQKEKRKTINGDDLLWAMTTLGFEDYVEPLKVYLQRFREIEGERTGLGRPQTSGEAGEHHRDAGVSDGGGYYGGGGMQYHQHHQFLHQQNHMYGATGGGGGNGGGGAASGRTRT